MRGSKVRMHRMHESLSVGIHGRPALGHQLSGAPGEKDKKQEHEEKQAEENLCDGLGARGYPRESHRTGNERDDEKDQSPFQHFGSPWDIGFTERHKVSGPDEFPIAKLTVNGAKIVSQGPMQ